MGTISNLADAIAFILLLGNILQYILGKNLEKRINALLQEEYNNFYYISRALNRLGKSLERDDSEADFRLVVSEETNYIKGIADSARMHLIAYGREEANYEVKYEHPAYPGEYGLPDEVKMGTPPDRLESPEEQS